MPKARTSLPVMIMTSLHAYADPVSHGLAGGVAGEPVRSGGRIRSDLARSGGVVETPLILRPNRPARCVQNGADHPESWRLGSDFSGRWGWINAVHDCPGMPSSASHSDRIGTGFSRTT